MGFWRRHPETDLERRLLAERPQPPEGLLRLLSIESPAPPSRGGRVPRLAFVGAVTLVLAASLGVAGALGYASKSIQSFGTSVYHVVVPAHTTSGSNGQGNDGKGGNGQGNGGNGNGGNGQGNGGNGGNGNGGDGDGHGHDPFHHEYDHRVPICRHGQEIQVPSKEYLYDLLHGDRPPPCRPTRR